MARPGIERFAPLAGIVFVVLTAIAFVISGETPSSDDSTREVLEFWTDEEDTQIASSLIAAWASVFLVWFAGSLRSALRGAEAAPAPGADRLAAIAFAGFVILAVGVLSFCAIAFAAADTAGDVPPEVTQTLSVLNADFFFISAGGTFLAFVATGIATLRFGGLPRWLGIIALVVGVLALTPVGFFAFLAGGLLVGVISILLFMRAGQTAGVGPAAGPDAGRTTPA